MIEHYRNTRKIANVNTLVDNLLDGKRTPLIKGFINSTRMENVSGTMSYFSAENGVLTSDADNPLERKWEIFMNAALCTGMNTPLDRKCESFMNDFYSLMGDSAEFIKTYENKLRYNFMIFHAREGFYKKQLILLHNAVLKEAEKLNTDVGFEWEFN